MPQLSDAIVKRLPLPAKGHTIIPDDKVPGLTGFGVRLTANGARSYVLRYRVKKTGRDRTYTIGDAGVWRVTEARDKAKKLKRLVDDGGDPSGDLKAERKAPDMAELCERFIAEHLPRVRASTRINYARLIELHILPFLGKNTKVAEVKFADVDALHRKLTKAGTPYIANRIAAILSKMFNLAIRWEMRTDNPTKGIERNYESKRKRYLSDDGAELTRLTAALFAHPDQQAADIVRLLLFTGCRKGEALAARWADLDLTKGVWTKLGSTIKQKTDHVAPLSAPARALLSRIREEQARAHPHRLPEYVFAGRFGHNHRASIKRNWAAICKAAAISGLRIHDLRHSFASQLVSSGHSLALIGALLGHSNPHTTARYAHLYDDPQRAAVERIGALIENAGKPAAQPVKLRG
jgi:integrase